jgi:hypothetical protein
MFQQVCDYFCNFYTTLELVYLLVRGTQTRLPQQVKINKLDTQYAQLRLNIRNEWQKIDAIDNKFAAACMRDCSTIFHSKVESYYIYRRLAKLYQELKHVITQKLLIYDGNGEVPSKWTDELITLLDFEEHVQTNTNMVVNSIRDTIWIELDFIAMYGILFMCGVGLYFQFMR